jgi:membrane protein implicated in regulation of membrane protease activity
VIAFLEQVVFWHWWILAVLLAIIEVFAPGAIFIWLGASAGVVGFVVLALPDTSWKIQLLIWSGLSVASAVGWRLYLKRNPTETDRPTLNRRGEQYVGRQFTLAEPVVDGLGKIRVDDSTWKIESDGDLPAGAKVQVTAVEGTVLKVEPA